MWPLLRDIIYDETTFFRALRLVLVAVSMGLEAGLIPTGVDNGGKTIGPWLTVISALVGPRPGVTKNGPPNGN